jgi:hypothetical protein
LATSVTSFSQQGDIYHGSAGQKLKSERLILLRPAAAGLRRDKNAEIRNRPEIIATEGSSKTSGE